MSTADTTVTLINKVGLHARPASLFVQTAARFTSQIRVSTNGGRTAEAKSILQVLQLGAAHGTRLVIHAEGDDAAEAVAALAELIQSKFGEAE